MKLGGAYLTDIGTIRKIDSYEQNVIMANNVKIPMNQIIKINFP